MSCSQSFPQTCRGPTRMGPVLTKDECLPGDMGPSPEGAGVQAGQRDTAGACCCFPALLTTLCHQCLQQSGSLPGLVGLVLVCFLQHLPNGPALSRRSPAPSI